MTTSKPTPNQPLTIAVSSRALFHIEDGNAIWEQHGQEAFNAYMREKENVPLRPGTAFPMIKKLLDLNIGQPSPLVNVVILSRNAPDAGARIMRSIKHYNLQIDQAIFTQGANRMRYVAGMNTHLFLSGNAKDVVDALSAGVAAATISPRETPDVSDPSIKIAFDGDSVIFGSESDEVYRSLGLDSFIAHEEANKHVPLSEGPFKRFLMALSQVQQGFPAGECPLKLGLVTARSVTNYERVFTTLREWGVQLDEVIFCGGKKKGPFLKAFGADIFFDDTQSNISNAQEYDIANGHVPFGQGGIVASP